MRHRTRREVIVSKGPSLSAMLDEVGIVRCEYGELHVVAEFGGDAQDR